MRRPVVLLMVALCSLPCLAGGPRARRRTLATGGKRMCRKTVKTLFLLAACTCIMAAPTAAWAQQGARFVTDPQGHIDHVYLFSRKQSGVDLRTVDDGSHALVG